MSTSALAFTQRCRLVSTLKREGAYIFIYSPAWMCFMVLVRSFWMDFGITLPTRFCAKASTKKSCTDCEAISPIRFSTVEVDALVGQISPSTLLLWFSKVLTSSGDIL